MSRGHGLQLCIALHRAHAALRLRLDDQLGMLHGLSCDDLMLMDWLSRQDAGKASLRKLATAQGLGLSAVLRRVLALEKIGMLEPSGQGAQRATRIREVARAALRSAEPTAERVGEALLKPLDPTAIAPLIEQLARLHS